MMQPISLGGSPTNLPPDAPRGLLLTADLLFSSRVSGTAAALGSAVQVAADVESALARGEAGGYRYVIFDLGLEEVAVAETVRRLRAAGCTAPVIAFGSHVNTARLQEAAGAGCAQVLPRSRFTQELAGILRACLAEG